MLHSPCDFFIIYTYLCHNLLKVLGFLISCNVFNCTAYHQSINQFKGVNKLKSGFDICCSMTCLHSFPSPCFSLHWRHHSPFQTEAAGSSTQSVSGQLWHLNDFRTIKPEEAEVEQAWAELGRFSGKAFLSLLSDSKHLYQVLLNCLHLQDFVMDLNRGMHMTQISRGLGDFATSFMDLLFACLVLKACKRACSNCPTLQEETGWLKPAEASQKWRWKDWKVIAQFSSVVFGFPCWTLIYVRLELCQAPARLLIWIGCFGSSVSSHRQSFIYIRLQHFRQRSIECSKEYSDIHCQILENLETLKNLGWQW